MKRAAFLVFLIPLLLTACGPSAKTEEAPGPWRLFEPPLVDHWQNAKTEGSGGAQREVNGFTLKEGTPITGTVFPTWEQDGLPLVDYRVTYDAMRVSGSDF